jgi:hypothetical protein
MRVKVAFVVLLFALLLPSSFEKSVTGFSSAIPCAQCWEQVGQVSLAYPGPAGYAAFFITYLNVNANVTGIVFMVMHNYLGQTVEISTATLQLAVGTNGTAFPVAFGLVPGANYSATFFVTATSGVAISQTTVETFMA